MKQAEVTSIEVLKTFRNQLIVYVSEARRTVEDARHNVSGMRQWLQHDRRTFWETELRKRRRALEDAQAFKFSADLNETSSGHEARKDLEKARRLMLEAENKLAYLKKLGRQYDSLVEPMAKPMDTFIYLLEADMPKAIAFLNKTIDTLQSYAQSSGMQSIAERVEPIRDSDIEAGGRSVPEDTHQATPDKQYPKSNAEYPISQERNKGDNTPDCGLRIADCGLRIADCGMDTRHPLAIPCGETP